MPLDDNLRQMFLRPPSGGNGRGVATAFQFTGIGGQLTNAQMFTNGTQSAVDQQMRSAQAGCPEMRNVRRHAFLVDEANVGSTLYEGEARREGDGRPGVNKGPQNTQWPVPQYEPPNYGRTPRSDGRSSGR